MKMIARWFGILTIVSGFVVPVSGHEEVFDELDSSGTAKSGEVDTEAKAKAEHYHGLAGGQAIQEFARQPRGMVRVELGKFNLGNSLKGMDRRYVRTRFWTMKPGGVIPYHEHVHRPAFVYMLQGEVVEYKRGVPSPKTIKEGELSTEDAETGHWWINNGKKDALMIAVDVFKPVDLDKHVRSKNADIETMGDFDLKAQFKDDPPNIPVGADYRMVGRRITIKPGGYIKERIGKDHPGMVCVIKGTAHEHAGDPEGPIERKQFTREKNCSLYDAGAGYYWSNESKEDVVLFEVIFHDRAEGD